MPSNTDSDAIMEDQTESDRQFPEFFQQSNNSFKYSNFGHNPILSRIREFVLEHKYLIALGTILLLVFISLCMDFSQNGRLSDLEGAKDKFTDFFFYDYESNGFDDDFLVSFDVLTKYKRQCHPFFCPGKDMSFCYCLSEEFTNFAGANQSCVEKLQGHMLQFHDPHEEEVFEFMTVRRRYRKTSFWVGIYKETPKSPKKWVDCEDCMDVEELQMHDDKVADSVVMEHDCLILAEGVLQQYPCLTPRLSKWEKKYIAKEDQHNLPYWMDTEVLAAKYGLSALCQCLDSTRAPFGQNQSELIRDNFGIYGNSYRYFVSHEKFLKQQDARGFCKDNSNNVCYLASLETRGEQSGLRQSDAVYHTVWMGGKRGISSEIYDWEKPGCSNNDLDFGVPFKDASKCYSIRENLGGTYSTQLHQSSCQNFQPFACQVPLKNIKSGSADENSIPIQLVDHLDSECGVLDCEKDSQECFCVLDNTYSWKEAKTVCGMKDMHFAVLSTPSDVSFLKTESKLYMDGYLAASVNNIEKRLNWITEERHYSPVRDSDIIEDWTNVTTDGCLYFTRGANPPFKIQNCEIPASVLCRFKISDFMAKWKQRKEDYE